MSPVFYSGPEDSLHRVLWQRNLDPNVPAGLRLMFCHSKSTPQFQLVPLKQMRTGLLDLPSGFPSKPQKGSPQECIFRVVLVHQLAIHNPGNNKNQNKHNKKDTRLTSPSGYTRLHNPEDVQQDF